MTKWKIYLSSTFSDLKDFRLELINLFQNQLNNQFVFSKIMEKMFDGGNFLPFVDECIEEVKNCDIYIIIIGNRIGSYPPNENRTYTEIELDTAIAHSKKIFCFQLRTNNDKQIDNKEKYLEILTKFDGRPTHLFSDLKELENILFKSLYQFASKSPVNHQNPYKGLASFNIDDGKYFFGRNEEIDECLKIIVNSKESVLMSIIGGSGVGKTSFVQAGLLYSLKKKEELGFSNFLQVVITPGSEPYSNLLYQFHLKGLEIDNVLNDDNCFDKIIIFFNQFEEVITQCNSNEAIIERQKLFQFLDNLIAGLKNKKCIILTTFRSDFLSQLANFNFIKKQIYFPLISLDYKIHSTNWLLSIKNIITQPALNHGITIEKELVTQLINEIKDVDGSLPILQFGLYRMWTSHTIIDRIITCSEYNELVLGKGLGGFIEMHAEDVIKRITNDGRDKEKEAVLKSIFINLVEVNDNFSDVKKSVKKQELFKKLSMYSSDIVNTIFEDLVSENSRLLVTTSVKDGSDMVDIIQEVLIRKWERIKIWINERREALVFQKKIKNDIKDFEKGQEQIYSNKKIAQVEQWEKSNPDLVDDDINDFIKLSKKKNKGSMKKIIIYSLVGLFIFLNVFQNPKVSFTKLAESTNFTFQNQYPDSIKENMFVIFNDTNFLSKIYEDSIKDEFHLIYNSNKSDSIYKIISLPNGILYQSSGGNISRIDTSKLLLEMLKFNNGKIENVKSIQLPKWVKSEAFMPFISLYTEKFHSYRNSCFVDFKNNKFILVTTNGIVYYPSIGDSITGYQITDSLLLCDLIYTEKFFLLFESNPYNPRMFSMGKSGKIYQLNHAIVKLFDDGDLYFDEGYKNLYFIDYINRKAKIFNAFIPQTIVELTNPRITIDLPNDFKIENPYNTHGLVIAKDINKILFNESNGEIFVLVKTPDNLYIKNVTRNTSTEIKGLNNNFNTYEIYARDNILTLISYSSYTSANTFLYRYRLSDLKKIDSLTLYINAIEQVDSNILDLIHTDSNKNLRISTIDKKNLKTQQTNIIFNLESRVIGRIYWSEDKKYLYYIDGTSIYFGSKDKPLKLVCVIPGSRFSINSVIANKKQLLIQTADKIYSIRRCMNILGMNLWTLDWPKVNTRADYWY